MKNILFLILILFTNYVFGQTIIDSNFLNNEYDNKNVFSNNGVKLKIRKKYEKISPNRRSFFKTSKSWSCMPRAFFYPIINKKNKGHYIFYFYINIISSPDEEGSFMKKIRPNWTPNKNYLGGNLCQQERDKNLIPIFTKSDFIKFNSDTALCIRVDTNAIYRDHDKFNDLIYLILHKDNVSDIYVCFAYEKEYEMEVIEEIKYLWKIIKFK